MGTHEDNRFNWVISIPLVKRRWRTIALLGFP
jgi:hypothetical protein